MVFLSVHVSIDAWLKVELRDLKLVHIGTVYRYKNLSRVGDDNQRLEMMIFSRKGILSILYTLKTVNIRQGCMVGCQTPHCH